MSVVSSVPLLKPQVLFNLTGHRAAVTALKFRNENQLISSGKDNDLLIWNLNTKDVRTYRFSQHTAPVNDIDSSSNEELIASCSDDCYIRLWAPTLRERTTKEIRAHQKPITSVQISHDMQWLISGSKDKCIKLWDLKTRKFLHSLVGHNHYVNCVRFIHDGSIAVSCGEDKTVRIWDVYDKDQIHTINNLGSTTKVAVFGKYVACAHQTGSVRIYDMIAGKINQHYLLDEEVTNVEWHPSGKYLLATCVSGFISVMDIMEGRPILKLYGWGNALTSIAFSPSGDIFACGDVNNHILVWNWNSVEDGAASPSTCPATPKRIEF